MEYGLSNETFFGRMMKKSKCKHQDQTKDLLIEGYMPNQHIYTVESIVFITLPNKFLIKKCSKK